MAKRAQGDQISLFEPGESAEQQQEWWSTAIDQLLQQHGYEAVDAWLDNYARHLEQLADQNRALAEADADLAAGSPAYTELVANIMEATREYYDFVGSLPEGMRRFVLTVNEVSTGELGEHGGILARLTRQGRAALFAPAIQSRRPGKYIMQLDAISSQLPALVDQNRLKVGARGHQPVKTTVTLDIPEHMRIEGGAALSTYDKSIINGVTSLLECGNTVFSLPMLYHAMTGKQNPTMDPQLLEELTVKLERMRRLMITIDLTDELRARMITDEAGVPLDVQDFTIEGYLLPLNKLSGTVNGKRTELFQLLDTPPLYSYSKLKRQLASVPITLLGAPVNNNATTIPLKTYLIQRIELMKNPHNNVKASNILYASVYSELGEADANKTRKLRIRTYTAKILDYFTAQGYIAGYTEYKSGRSVAGVRIRPGGKTQPRQA